MSYTGKVIVVTGATSGLGKEMALAFARAGANVVVSSRHQESCDAVVQEISDSGLPDALGVAAHVGSWDDDDRLIETAVEHFGRLDVLVNNAGSSPLYGGLDDLSRELVDKVFAVNLFGPLRLSIAAARAMSPGGAVLNISSSAAVQPMPYDLPYAMAKSGLQTMTVGLSKALAPDVRVNAIMAGPFATRVAANWTDETHARIEETVALERVGQPREVVGAALYLCGSDASYTTGAVLKVDGGMAWAPA